MWGATTRAIQGEWTEEAVDKAARYAENIWEQICDEKHSNVRVGSPQTRPEVIGILVQMHAANVVLFGAGETGVGLVQKYTTLMLNNWEHANLQDAKDSIEEGSWNSANEVLVLWSPVWHAMVLARKVVGGDTAMGKILRERLEMELEPLLQDSRVLLEENASSSPVRRRGLVLYEQLFNAMPS